MCLLNLGKIIFNFYEIIEGSMVHFSFHNTRQFPCFTSVSMFHINFQGAIFWQSLNIPMSHRAVDKLMKKLDVDENGEIDFA